MKHPLKIAEYTANWIYKLDEWQKQEKLKHEIVLELQLQ